MDTKKQIREELELVAAERSILQGQVAAEHGRVRELETQVLVQQNQIFELEGAEINLCTINNDLSVANAALDFEVDDLRDQVAALEAHIPHPADGPANGL